MIVRQRVFWIDFDSLFEVLNRILMVTHVLVHQAPLNIDSLIVSQVLLHVRELSQRLMKPLCPSIHQAEMEH